MLAFDEILLAGANHIAYPCSFYKDEVALQMTEYLEYSLSGSQFFAQNCINFAPYRLYHAYRLAEYGFVEESATYNNVKPFYSS